LVEKGDDILAGSKLGWGKFLPIVNRLFPNRPYELCPDDPKLCPDDPKLNPSFGVPESSLTRVTVLSPEFDPRVNFRLSVRYRRYLRLVS
jgi:hypothetical protein